MDARKAQKLTENILYQRIKSCPRDLSKITQLNITGRHLVDVSLLKKLPGLEILSLSVNKITTLVYFRYCRKLKALYLRQNKVKDLSEIRYLKSLPNLSMFSLLENPCASDSSYRLTVVKNLKNLRELDDIPIVSEERKRALKYGKEFFEEAEQFLESFESAEELYDNGQDSDNGVLSEGDDATRCEYETQSKEILDGVGDGDIKEEADNKSKKSNVSVRLRPETHSSSSCQVESKTVECHSSEFKTSKSFSSGYSAVLILIRELSRSELEALHAEIGTLLGTSFSDCGELVEQV